MPVSPCVKTRGNPPFYRASSPFYKPKGSSTLSGTRQVGPAVYYKLHFGLQCLRSGDFVVGFHAYLPTGYGLEPSCRCRQLRT